MKKLLSNISLLFSKRKREERIDEINNDPFIKDILNKSRTEFIKILNKNYDKNEVPEPEIKITFF